MSRENSPPKKAASRKLVLTRTFDAPRSLVFAAWTQPKHLKKWSAPRGFTIPVSEGDLRPGGKWRACMVTPDGDKLWLSGEYREVVPDELLVFTHAWTEDDGKRGTESIVTVRFSGVRGKTKVVLEQTGFDSDGSTEGHKGGWSECLERLEEHLSAATKRSRPSPVRRRVVGQTK
jgi:uncharacterized protein YndB with AHSA1/START domain